MTARNKWVYKGSYKIVGGVVSDMNSELGVAVCSVVGRRLLEVYMCVKSRLALKSKCLVDVRRLGVGVNVLK
jgi:hypothetical protein